MHTCIYINLDKLSPDCCFDPTLYPFCMIIIRLLLLLLLLMLLVVFLVGIVDFVFVNSI